jgi:hypothetical protein
MWYEINSITLFRDMDKRGHGISLHYTLFDEKENYLSLYTKKETTIAVSDLYIYEKNKIDQIEKYLFEFGKGFAKHLNIHFLSYYNGEFRCYNCNCSIGKNKINYEMYDIDKTKYQLSKELYKNLDLNRRVQINRDITINIQRYNEEIRKHMLCDECIEKIRIKYINKFNKYAEDCK